MSGFNALSTKGYARIYVDKPEDVPRVEEIIKELDAYEHEYMPKGIVAPFSEYPRLVYTHKFDALDMNHLTALCWLRGIKVWVCDNRSQDWLENPAKVSKNSSC